MGRGKKSKPTSPKFGEALINFGEKYPELFEQSLAAQFVQLNKMAAARRQLNTAIWLWFREGDPASIHTLAGAAFGVLSDLYFHRYKQRPVPLDTAHFPDELKGFEDDLRNGMAATHTFLKHALWDPDATHTFSVGWTEHYIFNAICAYSKLKGTLDKPNCDQVLMSLFINRFSLFHPDIFGGKISVPAFQEGWGIDSLKKLSRVDYFRRFGGPLFSAPPERD